MASNKVTIKDWLDSPEGKGRFDIAKWQREKHIHDNTEMAWVYMACDRVGWKWKWLSEFDSIGFKLTKSGKEPYELSVYMQRRCFDYLKCAYDKYTGALSRTDNEEGYIIRAICGEFSAAAGIKHILDKLDDVDTQLSKYLKEEFNKVLNQYFACRGGGPFSDINEYNIIDAVNNGWWDKKNFWFYSTMGKDVDELFDCLSFYKTNKIAEIVRAASDKNKRHSILDIASKNEDRYYVICTTTLLDKNDFSIEELVAAINDRKDVWYAMSKLERVMINGAREKEEREEEELERRLGGQ